MLSPPPSVLAKGFPGIPDSWTVECRMFPSAEPGLELFSVLYHKKSWTSPKALVVLHGMGEHSGRYAHVPHYVQSEVDAVLTYDHRGHGRSQGSRGHITRFDDLCDDAAVAIRRLDAELKKKFGKSEIHLLGHSLGGHLVLRALALHPDLPVRSVTASAPFLGIKAKVPAVKKLAAKGLAKVWPGLQLSTELDATHISHDPEVVRAYQADRLVHDKMTPLFFGLLTEAMADTLKKTHDIRIPTQILAPMGDLIVDPEKSLEVFAKIPAKKKRLKTYPGFYHEPMNEPGKEQVFADIASWIHEN